ncbi:putative CMP-N-acetylneuraminate-beta-galactosamide-alpha-2 [Triplophysa rosa]|uniref:CMP-N-acetylneuraminate-beta-galactosamide-alpha-2,3-sialyltransferase 1 n=2 Tax=Triplophysa rosa TaxID=992332 RepID=A0A9W7TLF3_TRIRA|nr:putative CMP-N-acetylneuraminate-beta-galactosamide-alpha-2 [Triplophysa rosa]
MYIFINKIHCPAPQKKKMTVFNRLGLRYITIFFSFMTYLVIYTRTSPMLFSVKPENVYMESSCSCQTCVMDFMEDEWFAYRHNPTVPPLLNRKNSVLRQDVYRWWMGLQHSSLKVNYTDIVDQLFTLFPDEDHYSDPGPDRCRTCAVVGNSGNLIGSRYGPLIDFHDVVIRINKGPTKGYEKDVGSKTTHRILYPESAVDLDNSTHLVLFPFKIRDMQWLISTFTTRHITRTYMPVKPSINANEDQVMILHPGFIKHVYDSWLQKHGRYPSTGFITLIFALHICDEVNVFGFGASSGGAWHHYFDQTNTHFKAGPHGGDFENKTIHELLQRKKISIYKGYR